MCQGQSLAHVVSGEAPEDDAEERMAIRRLRERAWTCDEAAIDKADERPQHRVLAERSASASRRSSTSMRCRTASNASPKSAPLAMCTAKPRERRPRPRNKTSE
jgi:hypothetical protein